MIKPDQKAPWEQSAPRQKLAVLCAPGMETFLGDIVGYLSHRYEIRTCYDGNNRSLNDAVAWADIIWVEWAAEIAVALSQGLPLHAQKRVICRLHSYEAFAGFVDQIKWDRIDDLIFVADHIRDYLVSRVPDLISRVGGIHVIPNGIDLDRFQLKVRCPGRNLAYLGYINYKKGPMLLLHAFAELARVAPEYRLHLGGAWQDDRYRLYYEQMSRELGLGDRIQFDGWITDVPGWLDDKQYIVCSSVLEAHPVGIMEAMACGVKPVVHNFVGARNIYESTHLWNTIDEFVQMVCSEEYDSAAYRSFVEHRYSLEQQLRRIDKMILSFAPAARNN